jgi:pimeloyl-ACP methyl ester carboxylesterase
VGAAEVILLGDSLGGGVVGGYPGRYGDVAAVVQDGWSNAGFSPEATASAAGALGPQLARGEDYPRVVPDEATCRRTALYEPGVAASLRSSWCRNGYGPVPVGDAAGVPRLVAENLAAIPAVRRDVPVLLVFGDHDAVFPRDKALAEYAYWQGGCGCDVELWTAKDAGHALAAHTAMPAYTAKVVAWLAARKLGPRAS